MKSALEVLREIRSRSSDGPAPDSLLDHFLEDDSIPAAICHSRALDQAFVLARNEGALAVLTEDDRRLPVLYFGEAAKLRQMGLDGLRALLHFREAFGPTVEILSVKVPRA